MRSPSAAAGGRTRWELALAPGSGPLTFRATPLDAPGERPVWMIAARQADAGERADLRRFAERVRDRLRP